MLFEILDNVLDETSVDHLYGYFRDERSWRFMGSGDANKNWRKFIMEIDNKHPLEKKLHSKAHEIFNSICNKDDYYLFRAYAGGYVYGTVHEIHTDGKFQGDIITVMFYLNKIWDITYGGETNFLDQPRKNILFSVIPKPSRALIFDGWYPHCAREVSRSCIELRMVATFKFKKKQ